MKLIFIDAEYTGEHAYTTLVSLGLVTLEGDALRVDLDDYDRDQVTEWLRENVLARLDPSEAVPSEEAYRRVAAFIEDYSAGERVHLVSAGLGSDLLLLLELYRHERPDLRWFHALHCLPPYLNHAGHLDLNTLLAVAGHNPDGDRDEFVGGDVPGARHDALHDARLAREAFLRLIHAPELHRLAALVEDRAE